MAHENSHSTSPEVNIEVVSDVVCPWCFIGKRRLEKALKLLTGLSGFLVGNFARLHVVRSGDNPLFWKLLKKTGEKGPAPILVNTSFNLFGEPLVVTPRDAVRSYYCSGTDALIIGSFLLTKR